MALMGLQSRKWDRRRQDTAAGATWQICKQLSQVNKIRVRRVGTSRRGSAKRRYGSSAVITYAIHNSKEGSMGAAALIISLGIT